MTSKEYRLVCGVKENQEPQLTQYLAELKERKNSSPEIRYSTILLEMAYRMRPSAQQSGTFNYLNHPPLLDDTLPAYDFRDDFAFLWDENQIIGHICGGFEKQNRGNGKYHRICNIYEIYALKEELIDLMRTAYHGQYQRERIEGRLADVGIDYEKEPHLTK